MFREYPGAPVQYRGSWGPHCNPSRSGSSPPDVTVRSGFSALRWTRRASFSRCFTCFAFSRSRFAMVVLPARAMVPSFYSSSLIGDRIGLPGYDPDGRRVVRVALVRAWARAGRAWVCSERARVSAPNPELAKFVTARRISSIGVSGESTEGSTSPSCVQRILSFGTVRFFL